VTIKYTIPLVILISVVIFLSVYLTLKEPPLKNLVYEPTGDLYINEISRDSRILDLKNNLGAIDAVSVQYKIKGLQNSEAVLEILKYSDSDFESWYNNHLASETITISAKENLMLCKNIDISGTTVKDCGYNGDSFSVIKYTFSIQNNIVVRILCSEGSYASAELHCEDIAKGVIEKDR